MGHRECQKFAEMEIIQHLGKTSATHIDTHYLSLITHHSSIINTPASIMHFVEQVKGT
jgi:hypothetical protein